MGTEVLKTVVSWSHIFVDFIFDLVVYSTWNFSSNKILLKRYMLLLLGISDLI